MTLDIKLLDPLVSRVRTDVHWKKVQGKPPFMLREPLGFLNEHLSGGSARGVCPIKAGESTTQVAVLDLDSHKGETSWEEMCTVAGKISMDCEGYGLSDISFSSSGGKGIHIYFVWGSPQDAYSVRALLRKILDLNGYSDGAGGVSKNQVEIFPKQDSVPLDGFGNMFILPYSGESVPLEPQLDYQRMPKDYAVEWPVSAPVPVVEKPAPVERAAAMGLDYRLVAAVESVSPDLPYDQWVRIGQAIHHETGGSEDGLSLWDSWSGCGMATNYPGLEELQAKWDTFGRSSSQPVTAGTIYKMATEAGWVDAPTADDFEDISNVPETPEPSNPLRFAVVKPSEFHAATPSGWFIKGVLPVADLAVFYGASGSGKSFFTFDMVCAVARGEAWRARRVKQARVVYIVAEGSGGFRNRLKAYTTRHEIPDDSLGIIAAAPNFLEKKDVHDVISSIKAFGECSIIVVDTWAQVTPGANENSGEDMGKALSHCRALTKATGAMVLLVHHSGKDAAKGARGWSGLRAAADCELEVVRNDDSRVATITKLKDGDDSPEFGFKLTSVAIGVDEDGDPVTSCVVEEAEVNEARKQPVGKGARTGENERLILDCIEEYYEVNNEWPSINDALELAMSKMPESSARPAGRRNNLNRALKALIERELVFEDGGFLSLEGL